MTPATKNILYIDTTTSRLMLAISQAGVLTQQEAVECASHRYHSALLIPAIQALLNQANMPAKALDAVAVNQGPGSFTGIRTGLITARTLGQFLPVSVHPFNAFELFAFNASQPVTVMLDALRGQIYHATLTFNETGPVYLSPPKLQRFGPEEPPLPLTGDCLISKTLLSKTRLPKFPNAEACVIADDLFSPTAMLSLLHRYPAHFTSPWREVRPLYLQEPSITLKKTTESSPN